MIDVAFHDKERIAMRATRTRDGATGALRDEYRLMIWSKVEPYNGLPDSVRQSYTRQQLLTLRAVIDEAIGQ